PDSPGAYSVFFRLAVVQPHDVRTFSIVTDSAPLFVNRYFATIDSSSGFALKDCSGCSKTNCPYAEPTKRERNRKKDRVLMMSFDLIGKILTGKRKPRSTQFPQII